MMCDHCLAPDTSSGAGIGCDNMTILIVAILNGRTKEEWYTWVTDRVKRSYGYDTPSTLPQLYSPSRLNAFRARKEAMEARARQKEQQEQQEKQEKHDDGIEGFLAGSGLSGFAKSLSTTGGISSTTGIMSDSGTLMFGTDDSDDDDDEDSGDEEIPSRSFFSDTLGLGRPQSPDPTKNLKAKLDEFENDIRKEDDDGDSQVVDAGDPKSDKEPSNVSQPQLRGEAPLSSKTLPNGDARAPVE